ncbi:MAG: citrate/2-methylcitrate synthase [Microvirga sp.]
MRSRPRGHRVRTLRRYCKGVEAAVERRKGKRIPLNIDGATAVIYGELGFPPPLTRGLFVLSRSVGILAHAWEQSQSPDRNKGPLPREWMSAYQGTPEPRFPDAQLSQSSSENE